MRATTPAFFRKLARLQDTLAAAAMPRLAAVERQAPSNGQPPRLVRREAAPKPLTFTLAEVAHA